MVLSPPPVFTQNSLALSQPKPNQEQQDQQERCLNLERLAQIRVVGKCLAASTYVARGGPKRGVGSVRYIRLSSATNIVTKH